MNSTIHEDAYAELFADPDTTETFLHLTAATRSASLDRLIELREEVALAADLAFEEPVIEEDACPFCWPEACDCDTRPAYLLQLIPVGQSSLIQGREVVREAVGTFVVSGQRVSTLTATQLLAA